MDHPGINSVAALTKWDWTTILLGCLNLAIKMHSPFSGSYHRAEQFWCQKDRELKNDRERQLVERKTMAMDMARAARAMNTMAKNDNKRSDQKDRNGRNG